MTLRIFSISLACALAACDGADVDQQVTIVVPAGIESIAQGSLHVSLFRYDPHLMDSPATRASFKSIPFTHTLGSATMARVHLRADGAPGDRYYLSVDGCVGEDAVLWGGFEVELPRLVTMRLRPHPAPCAADIES